MARLTISVLEKATKNTTKVSCTPPRLDRLALVLARSDAVVVGAEADVRHFHTRAQSMFELCSQLKSDLCHELPRGTVALVLLRTLGELYQEHPALRKMARLFSGHVMAQPDSAHDLSVPELVELVTS